MTKNKATIEGERAAKIMNENTENIQWANKPVIKSMVVSLSHNSLICWSERDNIWKINEIFIENFCKN